MVGFSGFFFLTLKHCILSVYVGSVSSMSLNPLGLNAAYAKKELIGLCVCIYIYLINNGIVLIKSPGTLGVYMDNSTSNT